MVVSKDERVRALSSFSVRTVGAGLLFSLEAWYLLMIGDYAFL
jgi:hypothetical protein